MNGSSLSKAHPSAKERGGIVIIVALMLLALLSLAAFSFSRTVIREISISGNVYQAGRADAAADAGLDWLLAWETEVQSGNAVPASAANAKAITDNITAAYAGIDIATGSSALFQNANVGSPDGMVLQGTNIDGTATQAFNLQVVYLGADDGVGRPKPTNRGNPSGGTDPNAGVGMVPTWEVVSTGQAVVPGDAWRFQSIRAAKISLPPKR